MTRECEDCGSLLGEEPGALLELVSDHTGERCIAFLKTRVRDLGMIYDHAHRRENELRDRVAELEAERERLRRVLVDRENIIRAVLRVDILGGALEERMIAAVGTWGKDDDPTDSVCTGCDQVAGHAGSCTWTEEDVEKVKARAAELSEVFGDPPRPSEARTWDVSPECFYVKGGAAGCQPSGDPCNACRYWNWGAKRDGAPDGPRTNEAQFSNGITLGGTEVAWLKRLTQLRAAGVDVDALLSRPETAETHIYPSERDPAVLRMRYQGKEYTLVPLPTGGTDSPSTPPSGKVEP